MKKQKLKLTTLVGAVVLTQALSAVAQDTDVNALFRRIEELEQRVKVLDRNRELAEEAAAEKAKTTPKVSLGAGGFSVASADSNFTFKVRGYVQTDGRFYASDRVDTAANDSFLIRRARPIFEGTVYQKFDYRVMLDFGAQSSLSTANNALLQDAYVTARLLPEFQIVAGKMKEPVGLERLQSGSNLLFPERAYPTQLLPNRDVGLQLQGDLFGGLLRYEAGVFNGVADGGSGDFDTTDSDKDVAGRLFAHPFRSTGIEALEGLGIGVAGTYGEQSGSLRNFVSAGLQRFFTYRTSSVATSPNVLSDGVHWRLTPQAYYYWGPFGLLAEYAISSQEVLQAGGGAGAGQRERLEHTGWQVAASYFVTGEANSFRAVTPRKPVTLAEGGGWGALELAARFTELDVDDDAFPIFANPATAATKATTWSVGANWHLNRNLKLSLDYDHTTFDAASGNPLADNKENVIITRVQFAF
jgi:phosphate-selective porin OprO/OprP